MTVLLTLNERMTPKIGTSENKCIYKNAHKHNITFAAATTDSFKRFTNILSTTYYRIESSIKEQQQ